MLEKIKRVFIIIGIIGLWVFMFQSIDLVLAKDPDYPTRPISLIIPYAAGGVTDNALRPLCDAVSKILGQPVVIVNKPGGGTTIGSMAILNAKPDGYTIGTTSGTSTFILPQTPESPFQGISGFTFVSNYGTFTQAVVVRSDAPYKNWKELIEYAKKRPPGEIKVGLVGSRSRSPQGMSFWTVEQKEGVKFSYLVFKSGGESLNAILGGHIPVDATALTPTHMQYFEQGTLRPIAVMSRFGVSGYNLPTFPDMYGFDSPSIGAIWGPVGIPGYILDKLDKAFEQAVKDPAFVKAMNGMSMPIIYMNRSEITKYVNEMYPKVGEMMKRLSEEEAKAK